MFDLTKTFVWKFFWKFSKMLTFCWLNQHLMTKMLENSSRIMNFTESYSKFHFVHNFIEIFVKRWIWIRFCGSIFLLKVAFIKKNPLFTCYLLQARHVLWRWKPTTLFEIKERLNTSFHHKYASGIIISTKLICSRW